ncbi:MAG: FAD:protein FMN transferase [Muribaculaceae bacterium]|nr:FAD:protein FMN transferase [Muribaculaceae bacterium]
MIWNTMYNVTYDGPATLRDSLMPQFNRVAASVSAFDSTSLVSRINRNETARTDSAFRHVYRMSQLVNGRSGGAFDPTVSPLVTAWGFGKGHKATADTARIDELLKYVGIGKTRLHGNLLLKNDPRLEFNFSAIAKGYGCDAVGEMFLRNGVSNFLIEVGGEILAHGESPRGGKWRVSVDMPIRSEGVVHQSQCVLKIGNEGVATSGNYRNYHEQKGHVYGHTIDPVTGRPVQTDVLSATVIAPTAMEADAYATAAMALGSARAQQMAQKYGLAMMLIMPGNKIWMSPGFKKYVVED